MRSTILVVDDDLPILGLMRNILREFGFQAITASTGSEALTIARERCPDLILLDKNMPGMSGEEVAQELRRDPALKSIPILIVSGEPLRADELIAIGADGSVTKPFDLPQLIATIRHHLDSHALAAEAGISGEMSQ
jgi:CheY-like chemotaxis protein